MILGVFFFSAPFTKKKLVKWYISAQCWNKIEKRKIGEGPARWDKNARICF